MKKLVASIFLRSFFLEELDEFEWESLVEIGSFEDPLSALFEFGGLWGAEPEIDFGSLVLADLDSHSGDVRDLLLGWYGVGQQQVLPKSVALASFKS